MDLVDIVAVLMAAYFIMKFLTPKKSLIDEDVIQQLVSTVMVKIEHHVDQHGRDMYLVHRADNNEFVGQSNKLDDIVPIVLANVKNNSVFFATDDQSLIGLFVAKEEAQ